MYCSPYYCWFNSSIYYSYKSKTNTNRKEKETMARTPMITRTLTATICEVLCVDVEAGDTIVETVKVPRTFKNDEALMKALRPLVETEQIKPVHIQSKTVKETLYGMTEAEFMEHAKVLPPRTTAEVPATETEADKKTKKK
jgi:hypothetical protein